MRTLDRWHLYGGIAALGLGSATAVAGPIGLLAGAFLCLIALVLTVQPQRACIISLSTALLFIVAVPTYGAPLSLKAVALGSSLLVLGISAARYKLISSVAPRGLVAAGSFLLYGAILSAIRGDPGAATLSGLTAVIAAVGVSLYIRLDHAHRGLLAKLVIMIMLIQVIHALVEVYFGYASFFGYMGRASVASDRTNELFSSIPGRAVGTFGHPILLGLYCAFATIVAQSRWFSYNVRVSAAIIGILGILLSGSRSAMIGLVLGLVTLYLSSKVQHSRTLTFLVSSSVLVIVAVRLGPTIGEYIADAGTSMSFTHRFSVLGTWQMLFDRPLIDIILGGGPQAMRNLLADKLVGKGGFLATDNQFILTLATLGLIGFIALVYVALRSLVNVQPQSRAVMVLSLFMMFSFDSLTWALPTVIFMLGAAGLPSTVLETEGPSNANIRRPETRHTEHTINFKDSM